MKATYYWKRIINDRVKLLFIVLFFLIVIFDLLIRIRYIPVGATPARADFCVYLVTNDVSYIFHSLLLFFLPLYLLIIACDDCFEDYNSGYKNILITKWGRKKYVKTNIVKGFTISFGLMLSALILNLLLARILCSGAVFSDYDQLLNSFKPTDLYYIGMQHPLITNLCFILTTSVLTGVVGAAGAALSMAIHNRKIVYPLLFILWYLPQNTDKSLMLSLQPFSEYNLDSILPIYLITLGMFILVAVIGAIKESRYAKV